MAPLLTRYRTASLAAFLTVAALFPLSVTEAAVQNARPISPLGNNDLQTLLAHTPADSPAGIYVSGPVYNAVSDQSSQAIFMPTASSGSVATFVIELSAFAATNHFGLYDFADPTKKVELFDGSAAPGSQTIVTFLSDGRVFVFFVDSGVTGFSGVYGFYIDVFEAPVSAGGDGNPATLDYTVYTEDSLNPGGKAQGIVYRGNGATTFSIAPFSPGLFTSTSWIIAFEDTLVGGPSGGTSDQDFSDVVVLVESALPALAAPIPTVSQWGFIVMTLLLLTGAKIYFGRALHPRERVAAL